MMRGTIPLITKGPFSLFLGGEQMLEILGDEPPGRAAIYLLIFTIIFQIFISTYKNYKNKQLQFVTNYAQNLRRSIVENVLNIYSIILILLFNIIALIYVVRQVLTFHMGINYKTISTFSHYMEIDDNKKKTTMTKITPDLIFVYMSIYFIYTLLPFLKSRALRLHIFEEGNNSKISICFQAICY